MSNSAFLDSKRRCFTVTMGQEEIAQLKRLASQARDFYWGLDPAEWNSPQDAGFLRNLKAGTLVLDSLAHHTAHHKLLRMADAQLAFFALHGFAAAAMAIPAAERRAAADMMCLLANCLTVRLGLDALPPEPDVPLTLAVDEIVSKHLLAMLHCKKSGTMQYELGMGDGLALYQALASVRCADLQVLATALDKATHLLRLALEDLTDGL